MYDQLVFSIENILTSFLRSCTYLREIADIEDDKNILEPFLISLCKPRMKFEYEIRKRTYPQRSFIKTIKRYKCDILGEMLSECCEINSQNTIKYMDCLSCYNNTSWIQFAYVLSIDLKSLCPVQVFLLGPANSKIQLDIN